MRLFREVTSVCQNCIYGNNEKGQWIKRRFKHIHIYNKNEKGKWIKNVDKIGYWHVYCEKKKRFFAWDKYKRCFKSYEKKFYIWNENKNDFKETNKE